MLPLVVLRRHSGDRAWWCTVRTGLPDDSGSGTGHESANRTNGNPAERPSGRHRNPRARTFVLDRQRTRREVAHAVRVEDVIPAEILDGVGDADRDHLEQVFRDPQKFLPQRPEPVREPEPDEAAGEPESRFARRAKLAGLVAAGA